MTRTDPGVFSRLHIGLSLVWAGDGDPGFGAEEVILLRGGCSEQTSPGRGGERKTLQDGVNPGFEEDLVF